MLPTREGLFNAYPVEIGIDETGPNNLATCIIRFDLYEELQPDGQWADCAGENWEITGYFYLEKKDGSLNTLTLDALKAALGWDGRDPFWLQETDLSEHPVQVKLGFEEYGGKTRIKVQYLNPFGSTGGGGVSKADDATRRTISNRLGSKLRAMAAPAPKTEPAPPAEPAAPVEQPRDPEAATMEEAWGEFCKHCPPPKWDQAAVEAEWFRIIAELFPGKQPDELTPAEWAAMRDQGPAQIIPF